MKEKQSEASDMFVIVWISRTLHIPTVGGGAGEDAHCFSPEYVSTSQRETCASSPPHRTQ